MKQRASQKQPLHPAFIGTLFFPSTSDETNVPRESYRRFQQIPTTRHSGKTDVSRLLIHQSLLTTLCIALYLLTASHATVPDQNVYKAQMTPRIPATQEQAFDITSAASVPVQVCPTNPKSPIKLDKQMMNLRRKWESCLSQSHRRITKKFPPMTSSDADFPARPVYDVHRSSSPLKHELFSQESSHVNPSHSDMSTVEREIQGMPIPYLWSSHRDTQRTYFSPDRLVLGSCVAKYRSRQSAYSLHSSQTKHEKEIHIGIAIVMRLIRFSTV